jgi:hypothetical protein
MTQHLQAAGPLIRGRGRFAPPPPDPEIVAARAELRDLRTKIAELTRRSVELEAVLAEKLRATLKKPRTHQ